MNETFAVKWGSPAEHLALPILGLRHVCLRVSHPTRLQSPAPALKRLHQPELEEVSARQSSSWWCQQRHATMTRIFCYGHRLSQSLWHPSDRKNFDCPGFSEETPLFRILPAPLGNQREAVVLQHCALCWLTSPASYWPTHSITVPRPAPWLAGTACYNLGASSAAENCTLWTDLQFWISDSTVGFPSLERACAKQLLLRTCAPDKPPQQPWPPLQPPIPTDATLFSL